MSDTTMKLSQKQREELAVIKYFIPSWCDFESITDEDIKTFFDWSDKGKPYVVNESNKLSGLAALHYGKQYREVHITMWKEDIKRGWLPKWDVMNDLPDEAKPWVERAIKGTGPDEGVYDMWKGMDVV